jgi:hypothetical protein
MGGVSKVELWYKKDAGLWTKYDDTASPWSWRFDIATTGGDGTYRFYSRAWDNAGYYEDAPATNDTSTILDTIEPESSMDALPTYTTTGTFMVAGTASDTNGILKVELWYRKDAESWVKYGDDTAPPWSWNFDTSTTGGDGKYQFYLVAWDNAGNNEDPPATNDTWTTVDTTKPTIDIESPASGSTATSSSFTVTWTGNDATSGIDHYEIKLDNDDYVPVGLETDYTFEKVSDGSHTIAVKGVDKAGNSEVMTFTLNVDTNPFSPTGPYYGLPLFLPIIAIAVCVLLTLWLRKRKKEPDDMLPHVQIQEPTPPPLSETRQTLPPPSSETPQRRSPPPPPPSKP